MTMLTTADIARRLGIRENRVRAKAAQLRNRGQPCGQRVGRQWIFTEGDVARIREPLRGGRPAHKAKP